MTPSTITGTRAAAAPMMKPASATCSRPPTSARTRRGSSVGGQAADRGVDDPDLRGEHVVGDAGAASGDLRGRPAGERGDQRRRGCRVADAHVAGDEAAGALGDEVERDGRAGVEGGARPRRRSAPDRPRGCGCRGGRCGRRCRPRAGTGWRHRRRPPSPRRRPRGRGRSPPRRRLAKLATIWAVTSWGHGLTPSARTPWSPANTATAAGSGIGGGTWPAIAASRVPSDSSRPRAPGGLVS